MPLTDDVPPEIWDHIAGFLPRHERPRLISLNRYFFAKVLHERYSEVRWTMLDSKMMRCLRRLQDPFIARYVQKLRVQAWFITQLFYRRALQQTLKKTIKQSVADRMQGVLDFFDPHPHVSTSFQGNDPTKYTPGQILLLMAQAISRMTNLTCYYFEWRDLPLTEDSQLFLRTVQNSANNLRKLELHAQIANFKYLVSYVYFKNLEDISFHFHYDTSCDKKGLEDFIEVNSGILETRVAPFINRFTSSLYRLSITVDTFTPMNSLFNSLTFLPNLRDVEFNMPFATTNSPQVLLNFLSKYSHILLRVKINPPYQRCARYHGAPEPDSGPESRLQMWSTITDLLLKSKSTLSNLESLEIPSTGEISTTLAIIGRSTSTLTRLCLSGRYFTPTEQLTIYDAFSSQPLYARLHHLRIDVTKFTLSVLYDIARHFPRLESLIVVAEAEPKPARHEYGEYLDPFTYTNDYQSTPATADQAVRINSHIIQTFHEWRLNDIGICFERYQEHQKRRIEYQAMMKVWQFVPSIKYFRGEEPCGGTEFWGFGV